METGFSGIHSRLDTLNGKVADHEQRIQSVENKTKQGERHDNKTDRRKEKWLDRIYNAVFSVILVGILWVLIATGILNPPV